RRSARPLPHEHDLLQAQLAVLDLGDVLELRGQPGDAAQCRALLALKLVAVVLRVKVLALGQGRSGARKHPLDHGIGARGGVLAFVWGFAHAPSIVSPVALRSVGVTEDHYFSARPASADERREIIVDLAGRSWTLETAPGVFSPGHVDLGTTVLLKEVPTPPPGPLLDLGCGWGPIALTAALLQPDAPVTAVDVNERALDLLRRNVERIARQTAIAPVTVATPDEVSPAAKVGRASCR